MTTQAIAKTDDVKVVSKKIAGMKEAVAAVDIKDAAAVKTMVQNITTLRKFVDQKKSALVDPAKAIIEEAKATYDPYINACKEAERDLKDRAMAHVLAERKKEDEKKQKIAQRVERGTMKAETAVAKMDEVEKTGATHGGVTVRMMPDIEIVDESKIPEEYWIRTLDTKKIRAVVLQANQEVPGVKRIEKPVGAFSGK